MQKIREDQIADVSAHLIKGTKRPPERAAAAKIGRPTRREDK